MKATLWALLLLLSASSPLFAMKNRFQDFPEPCDVVWKATVAVAKTQDYRLISISDEEKMISLAAGGFLSGERIISLTVAPAPEHGCRVAAKAVSQALPTPTALICLAASAYKQWAMTWSRNCRLPPLQKMRRSLIYEITARM